MRAKKILRVILDLVIGDPRDHHWSNPGFLNFLIPAALGIGGALFKKKSADKAATQQQRMQQDEMNRMRMFEEQQINDYNTSRSDKVNRRRQLLKAVINSKGWGGSKVWEQLGGMDAFFNRPVSGLKSVNSLGPAGQAQRQQTPSWWDVGGDILGSGANIAGGYFQNKQKQNDFDAAVKTSGYSPEDLARLKLSTMGGVRP